MAPMRRRGAALFCAFSLLSACLSSGADVVLGGSIQHGGHDDDDYYREPQRVTETSDDDNLMRKYELLNRAVKRQTKGSCSCTCETKPIGEGDSQRPVAGREPGDSSSEEGVRGGGDVRHQLMRTAVKPPVQSHSGGIQSPSGGRPVPVNPPTSRNSGASTSQQTNNKQGSSQQPRPDARAPVTADSRLSSHQYSDTQGMMGGEGEEEDGHEGEGGEERKHDDSGRQQATDVWGHGSRFPWKNLPDRMCFRESCRENTDCCLKFNLCDRSAKICVDCWHASTCQSEAQCCHKFPYCRMKSRIDEKTGRQVNEGGICVATL